MDRVDPRVAGARLDPVGAVGAEGVVARGAAGVGTVRRPVNGRGSMMPAVGSQSSANPHNARDARSDALIVATHVRALGRWIEILEAQGVHERDDGLIALTRRQQNLQEQQRKYGFAD